MFQMLYSYLWTIPWCLNFMYRRFGTLCSIFIGSVSIHPAYTIYEDETECSETSAHKIQLPWNRPRVRIQRVERSPQFFKICKTNSVDRLSRGSLKIFHCDEADDIFNSHFQLLYASLCGDRDCPSPFSISVVLGMVTSRAIMLKVIFYFPELWYGAEMRNYKFTCSSFFSSNWYDVLCWGTALNGFLCFRLVAVGQTMSLQNCGLWRSTVHLQEGRWINVKRWWNDNS